MGRSSPPENAQDLFVQAEQRGNTSRRGSTGGSPRPAHAASKSKRVFTREPRSSPACVIHCQLYASMPQQRQLQRRRLQVARPSPLNWTLHRVEHLRGKVRKRQVSLALTMYSSTLKLRPLPSRSASVPARKSDCKASSASRRPKTGMRNPLLLLHYMIRTGKRRKRYALLEVVKFGAFLPPSLRHSAPEPYPRGPSVSIRAATLVHI